MMNQRDHGDEMKVDVFGNPIGPGRTVLKHICHCCGRRDGSHTKTCSHGLALESGGQVTNSADPRTERAIAAEALGTEPFVESPAPDYAPSTDVKYQAQFEPTQADYYTTDGRWVPEYMAPAVQETPNERTERLTGKSVLGQPPGYGNTGWVDSQDPELPGRDYSATCAEVIKQACAKAPPPLDDVGGCAAEDFYPEELEELGFDPADDQALLELISELTEEPMLPVGSEDRKTFPIATGCLDYFPLALAEVARVSKIAGDKHHPGEPMHWEKGKSTDHADALVRHLVERGRFDHDGMRHTAKVAWRALALLQTELEG